MSGSIVVCHEGEGPIVATAIHDGHALRAECLERIELAEDARLREEDPFTARIAAIAATRLVATHSRFQVDLNRPRDKAVYRVPADAWGLEVWREPPPDDLVARSLAEYDAFYARLEQILRERERRYGRFVVLDIHSYNHCRAGAGCAEDPVANPEINVGTGTVNRALWGGLVERFCRELSAAGLDGRPLDVRENIKFQGGAMSRWIHATFPETGCAIALEFKKTFMDEWTGRADDAHLAGLARAVEATLPGLLESLRT